eukprot:GHVP01013946.1.p1 GENE.GHVP01013946.1~~GHVP01013946.1.p1  ORF type:complete len:585 (-),score=73.30 GHVP01013946.1:132-1886(-)
MLVGDFLLQRLEEIGVLDLFGVPGDFCLSVLNRALLRKGLKYIGCCNELNAAYAADGYARVAGVGAFCTTYAVGELSAYNGVAGAYAESCKVVVITGAPSTTSFKNKPLLHHTLGDYMIPYEAYKKITAAQCFINNPDTAIQDIDRVLRICLARSKPVYISICTDIVMTPLQESIPEFRFPQVPPSNKGAIEEAVIECLADIRKAKKPLFIPGSILLRAGLKEKFLELVEASGIPFSTMMLGKAMVDEEHPLFIGLYSGGRSRQYVRDRVENSDCVMILGEHMTDFNTGGFSAALDKLTTITVSADTVSVSYHKYEEVYMEEFIVELTKQIKRRDPSGMNIVAGKDSCTHRKNCDFSVMPENQLTMSRFFSRIARYLEEDSVVIAETGASLFSAAEVLMPRNTTFIGQVFYGSIGYTVGATLGVCVAAAHQKFKKKNIYLFIGDGSFQVTCQDLSTMIRYEYSPKIFLINNDGYTIERVIVDRTYNDIQPWKYHQLPAIFGAHDAITADCWCERELEEALNASIEKPETLAFIEVHFERFDCNESLKAAGLTMALNNRLLGNEEEESAAYRTRSASVASLGRVE